MKVTKENLNDKIITEEVSANTDIKFEEFTLDNGLGVILSVDKTIPSVTVNVCYHVGSKDEEPNRTGFAHLFEHLMFEGSKNVPAGDYDKFSVNAGGDNNAYTSFDKTNYYITLPSNQLELGLWLESDRMLEFSATEESFKTQQNVVIEEKKQTNDNQPYGSVSEKLSETMFKGTPYAWDVIGYPEHIQAATLQDAKDFFEKFYVPSNAVLSIVGDIDVNETKNLVEKYFGEIKRNTPKKLQSDVIIEPSEEIRQTIEDNVQLPGIFVGYRMPKENTKEFFDLNVLAYILSSGDSSRLYKNLMYNNELASDFGCFIDARESAGVFNLYAIAMPDVTLDELEKEIYRILEEVKNGNIEQKEIDKSINKIEMRYTTRKQYISTKADLLAHYKLFYGDANLINTNFNNYAFVTIDTITEAANKFLNPNNRVVLNYIPKNK